MTILKVEDGQVTATPPKIVTCKLGVVSMCTCELCLACRAVSELVEMVESYGNSSRIISAESDVYQKFKQIKEQYT